MTDMQTTVAPKSKKPWNQMLWVVVPLIIVMFIIFTMMVQGFRSRERGADIGLQQAKHAVLVYEANFKKLPELDGNVAQLDSKDVLGFPSGYKITYSGSPSAKSFCLRLDVSDLTFSFSGVPHFRYIQSSSDRVYNDKPTGC